MYFLTKKNRRKALLANNLYLLIAVLEYGEDSREQSFESMVVD